jgi:hypothetical protein
MDNNSYNGIDDNSNKMMMSKGLINLLSVIFWGSGAILFIAGFFYWNDLLGPIGYLVALTFVSDLILLIIRIVKFGFADWYVLLAIIELILMWIIGFLKTRNNS